MSRRLTELRDRKEGLTPPAQFTIRTLLLLMAGTALSLLAIIEIHRRFGPAAAAASVLALLSVFAHLAGAVLGDRLREAKDANTAEGDDDEVTYVRHLQPTEAQQSDFEPATKLSHKKELKRKPVGVAVGCGAIVCASLASVVLTIVMWERLAAVNVVFGAASAAVIGGLFGFWLSSLFQVARDAISEAQEKT